MACVPEMTVPPFYDITFLTNNPSFFFTFHNLKNVKKKYPAFTISLRLTANVYIKMVEMLLRYCSMQASNFHTKLV